MKAMREAGIQNEDVMKIKRMSLIQTDQKKL